MLHIVACPGGLYTDFLESRNPLGEDFGGYLQEGLSIDPEILAGLCGIGGRRGTADDLACVGELLPVDSRESLVMTAVDEHVQRSTLLA